MDIWVPEDQRNSEITFMSYFQLNNTLYNNTAEMVNVKLVYFYIIALHNIIVQYNNTDAVWDQYNIIRHCLDIIIYMILLATN